MTTCPNCKRKKTEFIESRKGIKDAQETVLDYYYCWDCDYLWKLEDGNFVLGAVIVGDEQDFPSFDDLEIVVVKSLNLKELDCPCIFCGAVAMRNADKRTYECSTCGGSWEVV